MEYVPSAPETSKVPFAPMVFPHILRVCLQGGGVFVNSGTVTFSSCTITGNTAYYVRAHAQKFPSPQWENALLTCQIRFSSFMIGAASIYQPGVRASAPETSKVPIAPMGFSHVSRLCLQGGGVYIISGTVSFSSCTITGNTADNVRAHVRKFPSPRWENR